MDVSGGYTYKEVNIEPDAITVGISGVEMSCMVDPYCCKWALPLDSFSWQRWRCRFGNCSGPLSSADHTPEEYRFHTSTNFWGPES